ncbi:MAG TPA: histidinol dehydrogenase [Polyangiaceae bacterium]
MIYEIPKDDQALEEVLRTRRTLLDPHELSQVVSVFNDVRTRGDAAIRAATEKFDQVWLSSFRIHDSVADGAVQELPDELRSAIDTCRLRIERVNASLLPLAESERQLDAHTTYGESYAPLDSVALWVPCRKGPLLSTATMLVAAAKVAGVPRIALCTPPRPDGTADAATLAAARLGGATEFYVGNGVAMIAGFTLGTDSLSTVAGIFGPGPSGITLAMGLAAMSGKRTCLGLGPSDCLVLCDETANPNLVARDLMTEAEHGPDSSSVLVTTSRELCERVQSALTAFIAEVAEPRRQVLEQLFDRGGRGALVLCRDLQSCVDFVNSFAPEHMSIVCSPENTEKVLARALIAGEILLGPYTPFSAANYALGITAVLPTNGYARSLSGLTSRDMLRFSTRGCLDAEGLSQLIPAISTLARYEGLPCHGQAAEARSTRPDE